MPTELSAVDWRSGTPERSRLPELDVLPPIDGGVRDGRRRTVRSVPDGENEAIHQGLPSRLDNSSASLLWRAPKETPRHGSPKGRVPSLRRAPWSGGSRSEGT